MRDNICWKVMTILILLDPCPFAQNDTQAAPPRTHKWYAGTQDSSIYNHADLGPICIPISTHLYKLFMEQRG